jgi:hypothetical protein
MPALRSDRQSFASAFPQAQPGDVPELARPREAQAQQSREVARKPMSKEEFLAFLDEWMSEPDDLGEEWWARFDEELKAHRLHFPDRDLP